MRLMGVDPSEATPEKAGSMKAKTILTKALAHATGKTEAEVVEAFDAMPVKIPDRDIPDDEAQRLLADLSKESAGIFNWLVDGARRFYAQTFDPERN